MESGFSSFRMFFWGFVLGRVLFCKVYINVYGFKLVSSFLVACVNLRGSEVVFVGGFKRLLGRGEI